MTTQSLSTPSSHNFLSVYTERKISQPFSITGWPLRSHKDQQSLSSSVPWAVMPSVSFLSQGLPCSSDQFKNPSHAYFILKYKNSSTYTNPLREERQCHWAVSRFCSDHTSGTRTSMQGTQALCSTTNASATRSSAHHVRGYLYASQRMKRDLIKVARNHHVKTQRLMHYSKMDCRGSYYSCITIQTSKPALTKLIPGHGIIHWSIGCFPDIHMGILCLSHLVSKVTLSSS